MFRFNEELGVLSDGVPQVDSSAFEAIEDPAIARTVRDHRNLGIIVSAVLGQWPEHGTFLRRSLRAHDEESLATVEEAAAHVVRLMGDEISTFCENYRWVCGLVNEEVPRFLRTGEYRCKTFAEAEEEVYSNQPYMEKYMNGLLVSQPLWYNHARAFFAFKRRFLSTLPPNADYLEIGPGHGLFLAQAAADPAIATVSAWDISVESLRLTAQALSRLGVTRAVDLKQRDVLASQPDEAFHGIVISEVLEHLEEPVRALRSLHRHLRDDGRIFINVPINSPAPDHIFALRTPEEAAELVRSAGLRIVDQSTEPMSGYTLARAMALQATVTCLFVAELSR